MNLKINSLKKYSSTIWVRFIGTLLTKVAQFMIYPYLALYLNNQLGGTVIEVSIILGLESFAGFMMNIFLGGLSDRLGRKPLMLFSLAVQGLTMIGLAFANQLWEVAVLITVLGAGSYLFFPAADAQIADIIPEESRSEVYSLLSLAANIGVTIGPVLGLSLFTANAKIGFIFFAIVSFAYLILVAIKIPETLPTHLTKKTISCPNKSLTKRVSNVSRLTSRECILLTTFTILAIPTSLFAAQMWSSLPFQLKQNFKDFNQVLMVLMVLRAAFSIGLQMWVGRSTEKLNSAKIVFIGYVFFAVAALGFGISYSLVVLIFMTLIYALAGMLVHVHMQKVISIWAPEDKRARYFSVFGLHWRVSEMLGPIIGGILFTYYSGKWMFTILSILLILAGISQFYLIEFIRIQEIEVQVDF